MFGVPVSSKTNVWSSLGYRVRVPAAQSTGTDKGCARWAREPKRVFREGSDLEKTPPKFNDETHRERKKVEFGMEGKKATFWAVRRRSAHKAQYERHEYEYCDVCVNRSDDNVLDDCFQVSQRLTSDPTTTPQQCHREIDNAANRADQQSARHVRQECKIPSLERKQRKKTHNIAETVQLKT